MALTVDVIVMWFVFWSAKLGVITESVERCKRYPDPKNGHIVCDSLFRLFCAPECDEGFTFEFKPAVVYMCGPLTGEWFTYPERENIPWPDCVRKESSEGNNVKDDVATRRAQITRKIHQTHQGMFRPMKPMQLTEHPKARYLHLFDYIQRAHQIYNDKQKLSLGYNTFRQQRQLELQQQKQQQQQQQQLLIQQQIQRRQKVIEQQKIVRQQQSVQGEMLEKQRQQRETLTESPITNNHQQIVAPQYTPWINPSNQYWQKNLQSNARVDSRFVSPVQAMSWSSYYPKVPQSTHERYLATYGTLQEKTRNNAANGNFNQQLSNSEERINSLGLNQQNVVLKSSLQNNQVERNLTPMKEQVRPATMSQPVTSAWQRPDFTDRVLPSSQRNDTPLTLHSVQHTQSDVDVSLKPITNQMTSPGVDANSTTQPQFKISSSNQLEAGNQINVSPKREPPQSLTQTVRGKVYGISVQGASSVLQPNDNGPPGVESKGDLNKTSQTERRGGVGDGVENRTQEKTQTKEKLFYFPIKRDTLIRLLPSNLQEKYRSLRETRNINSTYEASIDQKKDSSSVLEDMKVQQNETQKMDSSTNVSNLKYSVRQIKTGNDSITEYFDLLPQSTQHSSYQGEESVKSSNATIVPSTTVKN